MRGWLAALSLAASLLSAPAFGCELTKVGSAKDAKLKVYFTRFPKEDTTDGKYKKCRIVKKGGTPFFITPFRQDANVVVHRSNWPR